MLFIFIIMNRGPKVARKSRALDKESFYDS